MCRPIWNNIATTWKHFCEDWFVSCCPHSCQEGLLNYRHAVNHGIRSTQSTDYSMYGQKINKDQTKLRATTTDQSEKSKGGLTQAHSPTVKIYIPLVVDGDAGLQTCLASCSLHLLSSSYSTHADFCFLQICQFQVQPRTYEYRIWVFNIHWRNPNIKGIMNANYTCSISPGIIVCICTAFAFENPRQTKL